MLINKNLTTFISGFQPTRLFSTLTTSSSEWILTTFPSLSTGTYPYKKNTQDKKLNPEKDNLHSKKQ